jgi:hypothetical protein
MPVVKGGRQIDTLSHDHAAFAFGLLTPPLLLNAVHDDDTGAHGGSRLRRAPEEPTLARRCEQDEGARQVGRIE